MKKCIFAFLAAILLALVVVSPAYATGMNSNEQKAYDELCAMLDKYDEAGGGWLESSHAKQYKEEARSALLHEHVNLDEDDYQDVSNVLKKIDGILASCNSQEEAWDRYDEISNLVNRVTRKYDMQVFFDSESEEIHAVVKQTEFNFVQSGTVVALALVTLGIASLIAKKSKHFV